MCRLEAGVGTLRKLHQQQCDLRLTQRNRHATRLGVRVLLRARCF